MHPNIVETRGYEPPRGDGAAMVLNYESLLKEERGEEPPH
jgi:hypothetical protein